MTRLSRINTIWRKELTDTLRDRRTLIAMVLVPMALYPAMILGSLQGFEFQISRLKREEYKVAVAAIPDPNTGDVVDANQAGLWLRTLIDTDPARRPGTEGLPAEELVEKAEKGELPNDATTQPAGDRSAKERATADVRRQPPAYEVSTVPSADELVELVSAGTTHVGILLTGPPPTSAGEHCAEVTVFLDETDIRSQIAASGLQAIINRAADFLVAERLKREALQPTFLTPVKVTEHSTATPEKVGGSILGQIVPLILIIMTITGAIYPAIDLTAGERERGTLETLMVAPVPPVDLIAGKFVVVALIGMLSAGLNLLSIGGTIWLGGLGELLTRGGEVVIPLGSLPWVLLLLIPLAVMFSAILLAVCSFARSFKEAQNYVMPVMVGAMIPAVVGILPGTRLEGPMLIMPVTNITILTRDLFTGKFDPIAILWVMASTSLYAGAAVAVAARLFGQEAVLFADSGSVKTLFQRRFFKPADHPSAAQAFLLLAATFSINFFVQTALVQSWSRSHSMGPVEFFAAVAATLVTLFLLLPVIASAYLRARIPTTFALHPPPLLGVVAALCFGLSTWILAGAYFAWQSMWLPMPPEYAVEFGRVEAALRELSPLQVVLFLAIVPALCEEFLFRGYVLSGLRSGLGVPAAVLITALAFGLHHHSAFRLIITAGLGLAFALLVISFRSIWPAVIAHLMHNGIAALSQRDDGLKPLLTSVGYSSTADGLAPLPWILGAASLAIAGLVICATARGSLGGGQDTRPDTPAGLSTDDATFTRSSG